MQQNIFRSVWKQISGLVINEDTKLKNEDNLSNLSQLKKAESDSAELLVTKIQAESAQFALDQHSLVSITNIDGVITYVNDKFVQISGYQEHEILGKKHSLLNSNNQRKSYWKNMHDTVLAGKTWHDEVRNRAKSGEYYWVDTTIVPNYDSNKQIIGFTSIRTDITEQKQIQDNLAVAKIQADADAYTLSIAKEQAESAKYALDQHSLVSIADIDGNILYVNDKFVKISGYQEHEILGKKHNLLNSNNQPKSYWKNMHETVLSGQTWHDEVRNRAKNGEYYWVDTTIVPNYDTNKKVNGFTSIRTDITEQKQIQISLANAKIQAESAKYALDQHSLVSITDIDGNILYVNDKFVKISGYQEHEILGKKHAILNSNNQPKSYWKNMHETVLSGKTWHDEVRNRAKNGEYYWVDTTIVPNYDSNKKVNGFTSIRTDITQQKDNLYKLELAKEQAEVASVSKADFLANMSHEIRTPMNGVIGMTNLLLDSGLNQEQHKLAGTVKSSAVGLLNIINDILDFSKIEADKLDLELIPFNLGQMIEDIGTTLSFQSNAKGLQLICPATPIIQQWVKADPGRIRQVLTNLIGNAIKFTKYGEVAVYAELVEQTDKNKVFRFSVKDTGIGINEEQQKQLFDKFSQADTSTTRKYGGTGLGLSISKKLVELMGGEIGINSEVGQGATFWFTLPLLTAEDKTEATIYNTDIKNEKILIVDDNQTNLELMHQLHNIWEIPHTLVDSAKKALAELKLASQTNSPYTIAILDMHMPKVDGLELCKQIQQLPQYAQTKLIMASSQAQRGDAAMMKKAGFKGYLTKPIQQSELFDILLMVSGLKKSKSELITRHTTKELKKFKGHILVVEDNATNQLVIEGLLRSLGLTVDLAGNGQEAIAALQSMSNHDLVFMDCQMPVMDGYHATQTIRSEETPLKNHAIPIIAMTANAMAGDKQKCLDVGMDDYLSKPIDSQKVIDVLSRWLPSENINKGQSENVQHEAIGVKEELSNDLIDFDYQDMANRLMDDVELMKSVAELFCEEIPTNIAEIKTSIKEGDAARATAILHQIKGASANVGGIALSAFAREMELAGKEGSIDKLASQISQLENQFNALKKALEQALDMN